MDRREFLKIIAQAGFVGGTFGLIGCGKQESQTLGTFALKSADRGFVTLYDTNAMALYFDGSLGPETGVIKVDYVKAGQTITFDFWHGHNGILHRYTVTSDHFAQLKKLQRVQIETTEVADHTHLLFIDPTDARYRVPGAKPVTVEV